MSKSQTKETLLTDERDIYLLANRIERAEPHEWVAHDTETGASRDLRAVFGDKAALMPWAGAYCTGISVCVTHPGAEAREGFYIPVGHVRGNASPGAVRALLQGLGSTRAIHVLHHATFDWEVLEHLNGGYVPSARTIDTQVCRWLDNENKRKGLKTIAMQEWGEDEGREQRELRGLLQAPAKNITEAKRMLATAFPEDWHWSKAGNPVRPLPDTHGARMVEQLRTARSWGDITREEMFPYAGRDATMTADVADLYFSENGVTIPREAIDRQMRIEHICHGMTVKGVSVDIDQLHTAGAEYTLRADGIAAQYEEAYGPAMRQRFGPKMGEFNMGSPKQVAWLLFEHEKLPVKLRSPKTGEPSTDKNALEMLEGDPVAKGILEYRRWNHAVSAYTLPFARFAELSPDGRIHGHYSSTRTVTGRLSASAPNVMTIPRSDSLPEVRKAFSKVPPGIQRLGFDLASAELWVTASITDDPLLTETLLAGENLHIATMLAVFGGEPDKKRPQYTLSKNVNYGIEYGAGIDQIAIYAAKAGYGPKEAVQVAWQIRAGHKAAYARQHAFANVLADIACQDGKLPIGPLGRYRHFTHGVAYYTALNAMVQGGVAEFMKDVMIELENRGNFNEMLVLQVHDELVFDAPDEPGIADAIHAELTDISREVCRYKHILTWDGKAWA